MLPAGDIRALLQAWSPSHEWGPLRPLMKQVTVNLTEEQHAELKMRASETGMLQSEIIRRALVHAFETMQKIAPRPVSTTPVKFGGVLSPVLLARVVASPNVEKV